MIWFRFHKYLIITRAADILYVFTGLDIYDRFHTFENENVGRELLLSFGFVELIYEVGSIG